MATVNADGEKIPYGKHYSLAERIDNAGGPVPFGRHHVCGSPDGLIEPGRQHRRMDYRRRIHDAEYRYYGHPAAALQSLDRSGSVTYVGTFTKMLFNALRLGFVVVPQRLVSALEAARSFVDRRPPTLEQAILAEFITEGHFGHHVRRCASSTGNECRP